MRGTPGYGDDRGVTLIRTPTQAQEAPGLGSRPGTRRIMALLALTVVAVLIPLLGPAATLAGTGEEEAPGTPGIGLLRVVLFAALCVPIGELYTRRAARGLPGAPGEHPRNWAVPAAAAGFVAALGLAAVAAAGNEVPHSLSDMDMGTLYGNRDGMLALIEVNAFLLAGLCAHAGRPALQAWPVAAVVVAEAFRAHPHYEYYDPAVGTLLTLIHLTCAGLWTGGLLQVLRTLRIWRGDQARDAAITLLSRYARLAVVLLVGVTATGTCSTLRRMPPSTVMEQLTTTAYGRVMIVKLLLMAVVALLALWARIRLYRAADPLTAVVPARAEVVGLVLVLAVSGLLTAVPVPIRW
jgi:putative copper export protein